MSTTKQTHTLLEIAFLLNGEDPKDKPFPTEQIASITLGLLIGTINNHELLAFGPNGSNIDQHLDNIPGDFATRENAGQIYINSGDFLAFLDMGNYGVSEEEAGVKVYKGNGGSWLQELYKEHPFWNMEPDKSAVGDKGISESAKCMSDAASVKRWGPKRVAREKIKECVKDQIEKGCTCYHNELADFLEGLPHKELGVDKQYEITNIDFLCWTKEVYKEIAPERIKGRPGNRKPPACQIHSK